MTRKTTDLIEDMRNVVKPYIAKQLKQLNFENYGSTDKAEFETEFEMVLTLAEMANNQWIPCSERLPLGSKIVLLTIPAHVDAEGEHYSQGIICGHYIGGIFDDWGISDGTTVGYGLVRTKYGVNPTAWMPLPSIYQPKDSEDKE